MGFPQFSRYFRFELHADANLTMPNIQMQTKSICMVNETQNCSTLRDFCLFSVLLCRLLIKSSAEGFSMARGMVYFCSCGQRHFRSPIYCNTLPSPMSTLEWSASATRSMHDLSPREWATDVPTIGYIYKHSDNVMRKVSCRKSPHSY